MRYPSFLFAALLGILSACGGGNKQPAVDSTAASVSDSPYANISSPAAKVAGSYQGTLPCADCPGIDYQISLYDNSRYEELMVYRDRNNNRASIDTGMWKLENDSIIILARREKQKFLFEDGKLYQLDQEGKRITGALADNYILRPVEGGGNREHLEAKAKAGVDFVASGNEPFWSLEIDLKKKMTFRTMNGDSLLTPLPPPRPNTDSLKVYSAKTEAGQLTVTLRNSACSDDMSGFMRPYTVEVKMKEQIYRGCGTYLHK